MANQPEFKEFYTITDLKETLASLKKQHKTLGFVPTMGALHDGHLSLVRRSLIENQFTVVSIFVNPRQFNNPDDLQRYPRQKNQDINLMKKAGVQFVFIPEVEEVFPVNYQSVIQPDELENILEGEFRPGHFRGMREVVARLFGIVEPTRAYFGLKDYQQFILVKRLVESLVIKPEIIGCEIIRSSDGLALSSRNILLNVDQRREATILFEILTFIRLHHKEESINTLKKTIADKINQCKEVRLEYLIFANPETLKELKNVNNKRSFIVLIAAYVGKVRLIDNLIINN